MEYLTRSYSELMKHESFYERLAYLQLFDGNVSSPREISQEFYKSDLWIRMREKIILRDFGCDLGSKGIYIRGPIIVHHINPIDKNDILNRTDKLLDPENLIATSINTHNKIHYKKSDTHEDYQERKEGDTIPWKKMYMTN